MSKIQMPALSGEILALSDAWRNQTNRTLGRDPREILPLWQAHPSSSSVGSLPIGCYDTSNTSAGREAFMCPVVYQGSTFDTGTGHRMLVHCMEQYANNHPLTDSGDGLTFTCPDIAWIEDTGNYAVEVWVNGALYPTGYTIDYAKGTVTFSTSQAGNTVSWYGYWLDPVMIYTKSYDTAIKTYGVNDAILTAIMPYNFRFDHWTSSTQPTDWTKSGTCGQQTAYFKPVGYDCELTATTGITKISQTLGTVYDQVSAYAIARASNKMTLRVSVDGGANWSVIALATDATSTNKWVGLLVQSSSGGTSPPIVEFMPQVSTSDTGTARVAYIGMFLGGLNT